MIDETRLAAELAKLKDFQRRTVEHVFRRLYLDQPAARRFLVADEVGLGKTMVARGLIAKVIHRLQDSVRVDIIYVCSNTAIASQSLQRLNVLDQDHARHATRLTLLPAQLRELRKNRVNFVSFTPGTTFDLKQRSGTKEERALLVKMLDGQLDLRSPQLRRAAITRQQIETLLRTVMCRTERTASTYDRDATLSEQRRDAPLTRADIDQAVAVDRFSSLVGAGDALEYWKSAPYLVSFMESYKLKERLLELRAARHESLAALDQNTPFLLRQAHFDTYSPLDPGNARLRALVAEVSSARPGPTGSPPPVGSSRVSTRSITRATPVWSSRRGNRRQTVRPNHHKRRDDEPCFRAHSGLASADGSVVVPTIRHTFRGAANEGRQERDARGRQDPAETFQQP